MPSCSDHDSPALCDDVLEHIFSLATKSAPLREQLKLKHVNRRTREFVRRQMARNDELLVEIFEPQQFRLVGLRKERLKQPEPHIMVQGSRARSLSSAIALVRAALASVRVLRTVRLYSKDPDPNQIVFNAILNELLEKDSVQLHTIKLRRRHLGSGMSWTIAKLVSRPRARVMPDAQMSANAASLRVIGQLSLGEASECLPAGLRLGRLSLNAFDAGFDADASSICSKMLSIIELDIRTEHLSFTSLEGFDPTDDVIQRFLTALACSSLRMTMISGPYVPPQPDYMIGKVRQIEKLEMVEVVEKTNIFNTLVTFEKIMKKVFPNVDDINYLQDWRRR